MKGKPLPKPEIKSEVKSPSQIKSKPKFLPGFAIVALEPDKWDARPFGIGNLTQAYTSNDAMMEIELYMPDTLSDIVISRYTAVKERRGIKKTSILAKQISYHSFDLNAGTLPLGPEGRRQRFWEATEAIQ